MPSPITLELAQDAYYRVELGPKPGVPDWHIQSRPTSYNFPTPESAATFAQGHFEPGRYVHIHFPNGEIWDGNQWLSRTA